MFDALTDRFSNVFRNLRGKGRISEDNVREAMREIRTALLEADVNIDDRQEVLRRLHRKGASGRKSSRRLKPDQVIVKDRSRRAGWAHGADRDADPVRLAAAH
jgi:signal recognition particle subunit SRP54